MLDHKKVNVKIDREKRLQLDGPYLEGQAKNLAKIVQVSELLNATRLLDRDVPLLARFMKELPCFESKFELDNKQQQKYCLEKMKIRICCRAQPLFRQGDAPKYAYVVILGVVNFYDDRIKLDPHGFDKNDYQVLKKNDDGFRSEDGDDSFQEKDQAYFETINHHVRKSRGQNEDESAALLAETESKGDRLADAADNVREFQ